MNTLEKLDQIHSSKDTAKYKALPLEDRIKLNQMWRGLEWLMRDPEIMRSTESQRAFFEYFEIEDAALIKKAHEKIFCPET